MFANKVLDEARNVLEIRPVMLRNATVVYKAWTAMLWWIRHVRAYLPIIN